MPESAFQEAEVQDALDTTDQLHMDVSRLKRLGILSSEERETAKEHIDEVADKLTEKLPSEKKDSS
jgi:FtsZ-binding cell division protein ZapB